MGSLVSARGGGGKGGSENTAGSDGTSYGAGGAGGTKGRSLTFQEIISGNFPNLRRINATAGSPGWIYIEYGGDI